MRIGIRSRKIANQNHYELVYATKNYTLKSSGGRLDGDIERTYISKAASVDANLEELLR